MSTNDTEVENRMLHLQNIAFESLGEYVKARKLRIVVYGAGMIGKIVIPDLIVRSGLLDYVDCYVDADIRKQGEYIRMKDKLIQIESPTVLETIAKESILFITNSNYGAVLSMLDEKAHLDNMDAVIIPIVQAIEVRNRKDACKVVLPSGSEDKIPKIIHYCWFSGKELPEYLKKCIESWKEKCPDYEIIRWDESNYDIHKNPYMEQAYQAEKWGFVPDYARLDILYNYGGFYLDTDVELIRSLDDLRNQGAFCGVEKWGNINMGGCSGAVKQHPMIGEMLAYRENIPFIYPDGTMNLETCGIYETRPFIEKGMKINNTTQRINDMTVFSSDFFHPYDYMSGETILTENTFSIHHFNGGWLTEQARQDIIKTMEKYKQMLKRMEIEYGEI